MIYGFATHALLGWLLRYLLFYHSVSGVYPLGVKVLYWTKPFLGQSYYFVKTDASYDREDGIARGVVTVVEVHHALQGGLLYVFDAYTYCGPAIGVYLIGHGSYEVLHIAIRAVEVALLKLFDDHAFLYFYAFFGECKA
jgi:hypothetical protein